MDLGSILASISGSGSLLVLGYNWWFSKKSAKVVENTEERNEEREPLVRESLALRNASDAVDIVREALEVSEDARRRVREDFREFKVESETRYASLLKGTERLRDRITALEQELMQYKNQT